jgi:phosphate-selective porin OprO/OprP
MREIRLLRGSERKHLALVPAAAFLVLLLVLPAAAQDGEPGRGSSPRGDDGGIFVMGDRPSFRFGELRLDITTKLDLEMRNSPDVDVHSVEMEHGRVGVDGRFSDLLGFQVEAELSDEDQPWRDVYVEMRKWRTFRLKGGRFKMPFGQERLTSISDLDFAHRSIPTEALTPGRDIGVEANGRLFDRHLNYMAGLFHRDGDAWRGDEDRPAHRTFAGRIVGTPFAWSSYRVLQRVEVGGGFTRGDVPEGLNGVTVRTVNGYEAFAPVYVSGTRQRLGADAALAQGPFAIRAEFLQLRDERKHQGLGDDDLPGITARGWLATATSFVVGSLRSNSAPRAPVGRGGAGAIQLAVRVESLAFVNDGPADQALRNPRAVSVLPNDALGATFGVNWFPVRFFKVQLNLVRERLQDPERRPDPASAWITSGMVRVQFSM